jgi:hypothetical protein
MIGSGGPNDPHRVNLPTWTLVEIADDGSVALVDVPDADIPPGFIITAPDLAVRQLTGRDLARASGAMLRRLYDHLDARYVEHAGEYRPV